ncbi:hypothetical protein BJV82DRAFT_522002 [Fennellomyces sp. T-0311]|nr:hypothetical protein BJV82DRAFT_522002 [Fennellomyces sp. T-0311]
MHLSLLALTLFAGRAVSAIPLLQARDVQSATTAANSTEIAIHSGDDFCLFLPPQPGLEVAPYEDIGKPFCSKQDGVPGAEAFPEGFITVAHYEKSETYEQVTGYFDRTKYGLLEDDGGGQYDNHGNGKPMGASCTGYSFFVSMIEPSDNRFCIRCCQNTADCPTGRSEYGCLRIIPGDYSQGDNSTAQDSLPSGQQDDRTVSAHSNGDTDWEIPPVERSFDAIASVIKVIQTELDNGTPLDEIQTYWTHFLNKLGDQFPDDSHIGKLQDITSDFNTKEDWEELVKVFGNSDASQHQDQASW